MNNKIQENDWCKTIRLIINIINHILIAITIFLTIWYTCASGHMNVLQIHIILCIFGYQFLMCQGMLVLSNNNSWSPFLTLISRRTIHWVVQSTGSLFCIVGSILIMQSKTVNFTTPHGILGMCALSLCVISLINGTLSYFTYELRSFLNGKWSKLSHIVTGIATLALSSASLCLGFDSGLFRYWATNRITDIVITFTVIFSCLVIVDPIAVAINKTSS